MVKEFTQISLKGRFDLDRHLLADNQVLNGRSGVHVYSLFLTEHGEALLVNRGWKALPANRSLPVIETVAGLFLISGRLGSLPVPGRQLGPPDIVDPEHWPQLLTYPDLATMESALGMDLYPWVLYLDEASPGGFEGRDWKPVFMTPDKHRAYAFQWFALAFASFLAWVFLGVRRGRMA